MPIDRHPQSPRDGDGPAGPNETLERDAPSTGKLPTTDDPQRLAHKVPEVRGWPIAGGTPAVRYVVNASFIRDGHDAAEIRHYRFFLGAIALAGCDTRPASDFEKKYQDVKKARVADRYADLGGLEGRCGRYLAADAPQRRRYLASWSSTARAAVTAALPTLAEDDAQVPAGVRTTCRAAITAALAIAPTTDAADVAATRIAPIGACRRAAIAAEEAAPGGAAAPIRGWRRAASSAMAVVGMTVIEGGNQDRGIAIWRQADAAMRMDAPGYSLRATDFY